MYNAKGFFDSTILQQIPLILQHAVLRFPRSKKSPHSTDIGKKGGIQGFLYGMVTVVIELLPKT